MLVLLVVVVLAVVSVRRSVLISEVVSEASLEPGDILFVDLYDGWCQAGYWDHMALYVGEEPYAGVVEATYNAGVCYTALPAFLERDEPAEIAVLRLKGDLENRSGIIKQAVAYALSEVGRAFDFTATATVPLKLNEQNVHCAEVVWRAYWAAGINLDGDDGPFLYPDDIYYCHHLEPIWR